MKWHHVRPFFEALWFDLGPREINRRSGVSMGALYDLMNGVTRQPASRTMRDIMDAHRARQAEVSETERGAGVGIGR